MSTALITGASNGIGLELAKRLAADGHDVILVARSVDKLQAIANDLNQRHGIQADVIGQDLVTKVRPSNWLKNWVIVV